MVVNQSKRGGLFCGFMSPHGLDLSSSFGLAGSVVEVLLSVESGFLDLSSHVGGDIKLISVEGGFLSSPYGEGLMNFEGPYGISGINWLLLEPSNMTG